MYGIMQRQESKERERKKERKKEKERERERERESVQEQRRNSGERTIEEREKDRASKEAERKEREREKGKERRKVTNEEERERRNLVGPPSFNRERMKEGPRAFQVAAIMHREKCAWGQTGQKNVMALLILMADLLRALNVP